MDDRMHRLTMLSYVEKFVELREWYLISGFWIKIPLQIRSTRATRDNAADYRGRKQRGNKPEDAIKASPFPPLTGGKRGAIPSLLLEPPRPPPFEPLRRSAAELIPR